MQSLIGILAICAVVATAGLLLLRRYVLSHPGTWWGPFFKQAQYERFMALVEPHLQMEGFTCEKRENGTIEFHEISPKDPSNPDMATVWLGNVARACAASPAEDWPRIVDEFFGELAAMRKAQERMDEELADYETARGSLRLALRDQAYIDAIPPDKDGHRDILHTESPLPGLVHLLLYDTKHASMSMTHKQLEQWGRPLDQVMDDAFENVVRHHPVTFQQLDGHTVFIAEDNEPYVGAHALRLDQYFNIVGREGALVALPTRNLLLAAPINNAGDTMKSLNEFFNILTASQNAAGGLSHSLYWFRQGTWTLLPYSVTRNKVSFTPPEEFNQMIVELTKAEE